MRWKPKPIKPRPDTGTKRHKVVFAFLPHHIERASGSCGWEECWVWLEWIVREQIYWGVGWDTWNWYPKEAKSYFGL
jgi:hypothetical protein